MRERRRRGPGQLGADHREEDLGRQHAEIAAEHDRIAEVGDALDEADQEGVGEARPHQRQRDGGETCVQRSGAQRLRGFLEASAIRPATTPISTRKAIGVNAKHLREQHAVEAVDPARRAAMPNRLPSPLIDQAGAAEDQDQRRAR